MNAIALWLTTKSPHGTAGLANAKIRPCLHVLAGTAVAIRVVLQVPGEEPRRLVWTDRHPKSAGGLGVLRYKMSSELLDGETFLRLRDEAGAYLVTSHPRKIRLALGLPSDCVGVEEKSDW